MSVPQFRSRVHISVGGSAWLRRIAVGLSAVLMLTLADVPRLAEQASAASNTARTVPQCPEQRPDEMSALVTARLCGGRVEVASLLSETTRVWAQPDGSMYADVHLGPVRVRDQQGKWRDVDLTLQRLPDGSVASKVHPKGLRLSGAAGNGRHEIVALGEGDERIALEWVGVLPQPQLSGTKATYVDVRPGVDLVIEATRTGFEQFFVVKDRSAVNQVASLPLRVRSASLDVAGDGAGGLEMRKRSDRSVVGHAAAPDMWDAQVDPRSLEPMRRTRVGMSLKNTGAGSAELTLTPDRAWLTDTATKFPVTIDPSFDINVGFDTWVQTGWTSDQSASTELKLGTYDGGVNKARSFLHIPATNFAGKQVLDAWLWLWEWHSYSCRAAEWELWWTGLASTSTRWDNQPKWNGRFSKSTETKGYSSSCNDGWVKINARDFFYPAADGSWGGVAAGLKAANENDSDSWKRFNSANAATNIPHIEIVYNSLPKVTARSTTPSMPCVTGSGRPYINTTTPTLKSTVSDPDGGSVKAWIDVWPTGGTGSVSWHETAMAPSGSTVSATVPSGRLTAGGTYSWRTAADDGLTFSADGIGNQTWSSWCEFTIDTTPPSTPTVSSTTHPSQTAWYPSRTFSGTVSATDAAGISGWAVKFDQSSGTSAGTTVTQTSSTVSASNLIDGVHWLHVAAKDKAGNWSSTRHFKIQVDGTKPGAPSNLTSSTHPVSTNWYSSRTVTVSWSAPSDLSGIAQYAVKVDQVSTTIPATTDSVQTGTSTTKTVAADGVWWLHVRAKDNAGNWSDTAAHFKFQVDTSAPPSPTVTSSTHPDQNRAYPSGAFSGSWAPPTGGASGYSVVVDSNATTVPPAVVTTTGTTHTTTVGDGVWYLHVRAKDAAGNWGSTAHFRFTVDTIAPTTPAVTSTDYPANTWSGAANQSGVFTFDPTGSSDVVDYLWSMDSSPPTTMEAAPAPGAPLQLTIIPETDGAHVLYLQTRDSAGNLSPVTAYTFAVGSPGELLTPAVGDISAGQLALQATGHPSTVAVTYQWRRADVDNWVDIPAGDVTYAAGGGGVTWPVASSGDGAYPKLNWNMQATVNAAESGPDPLDGPLQVRAVFSWPSDGHYLANSNPVKITFDRNRALGASAEIGPGSVNLITGNYTVGQSDASTPAGTVARSFNTREPGGVDPMFGPGWVSTIAAGAAPYTGLDVFGSLVQVGLPAGEVLGFTQTGPTTFDPPIGSETLRLVYDPGVDTYTLTDGDGVAVIFGRNVGDPTGHYALRSVNPPGSADISTITYQQVTVDGKALLQPTRVLAPVPAGVNCDTGLARGCRALTFTYATTTTATGTASADWGDYTGRLSTVSFTAWDPDANPAGMRTIEVARYSYDNTGRLRAAWDPRLDWSDEVVHHLQTIYDYDSDGILTSITPPGQEPWQLSYTTIPGDPGKGRLAAVTRSALAAGTATTTVVYQVPVSGAGAPYDLSPQQTVRWGQTEAPVQATAVFPATQIPDGNQPAGQLPSSYERATITYLDANARTVNTVQPGGYITTTWYDQWGHTVRELTAGNRQRALDASDTDDASAETMLAYALSTRYVYSADGQRLIRTMGPEHDVILDDGTLVRGRINTSYTYDQGAPAEGGPYNLVTTQVDSVHWWDGGGVEHEADPRTTTTTYDWNLRQPTVVTVDPAGLALTTSTTYDSDGRILTQTMPAGGASTNTPSTRVTVYYTTAANSTWPECGDRPEWAGMVCRTQPGGQPDSGPELPATVMTYDMYGQPRSRIEKTSAGELRRTETMYDHAGRPLEVSIIAASGLGEPLEKRRNVYDPATGQLVRTQSVNASNTVTAEIIREYDTLGRLISYTDADGNTSTTTYDLMSRPLTTSDGKATRTYSYDDGVERRGLLTQVVDSQAGTFTGLYDADGNLITENRPDSIVVSITGSENGDVRNITYTKDGCGQPNCILFSETVYATAHGQVRASVSTLSSQRYGYDAAGRLTSVADTAAGSCTTRVYTFTTSSNRRGLTTYASGPDGGCQSTVPSSTQTWTFDTADRLTTSGYTYDALGRTLTMASADSAVPEGESLSMTYHVNDMVRTITQGSRTATYTLDVNVGRFRSWIDSRAGGVTKTNHYSTDNDSPAWTDEGDGTYSRTLIGIAGVVGSISGPDGAITWLISNQRGDFVAGIAAGTAGITYTSEYTEYGLPRNPDDAGSRRYGWFGAAQRAGDTPGGLVLMGVRVYAPGNGRFLQVDPIYGGSANSYDYANQDPINQSDASGCAPYRCYIPSWAWRGYVAWADLMTVYLYTSPWYPTELNWLGYVLADYNPVFVLHSMQVQYRIRERVRVKCTVTARYGTGRFQVYSVQMAYAEWQDRYRARYRIRFTTIVTAWTYGFWLTYKISNIRYGRSGYYYT